MYSNTFAATVAAGAGDESHRVVVHLRKAVMKSGGRIERGRGQILMIVKVLMTVKKKTERKIFKMGMIKKSMMMIKEEGVVKMIIMMMIRIVRVDEISEMVIRVMKVEKVMIARMVIIVIRTTNKVYSLFFCIHFLELLRCYLTSLLF